jgi:hypothetical protein
LPGVREIYLPRTPPPNKLYSVSGAAALYHALSAYISTAFLLHPEVTLAGARDHVGIRFSSVNKANRSSADAWNVASTSTVDVLIFREDAAAFFASPGVPLLADAGRDVGAGELVRLGSFEPTIMSLPWVSTKSTGNAANFVSRAVGSFCFASS